MGSTSRDLEGRVLELQRQVEEEQRRSNSASKLAEDSGKEAAATQSLVSGCGGKGGGSPAIPGEWLWGKRGWQP